jgi:hypothetical protein
MGRHAEIKDIEHRIRSSMIYHAWVEQNLGPGCIRCDSTDNLQVHHIVELYHILLGLWKLYGDTEMVVAHAQAMHVDDKCEAVTLCDKCHEKVHPGRHILASEKDIRIENWCVLPRTLPGPLIHHAAKAHEHGLSLVGAQLLAALGWYILNGHLDSRIIEFKRSAVASLLGKNPGTSFNRSLERGLNDLQSLDVLLAWHISKPLVEVHLSKDYLRKLDELPWFMAMTDVHTSKMPVFALRWFLNLQSGRRNYKIGKNKLVGHLGLKTSTPAFVQRCVLKACEQTGWANAQFDGKLFRFSLKRRGAVPIWSLRSLVRDAIREGS